MSDTSQTAALELAERERRAARRIDMSPYRASLFGGAAAIVLSWILPFTGHLAGYDIGLVTDRSVQYGISAPERMFVWLSALGPVVLTLLAYLRKSTLLAQWAWALSGITMFFSLFAIWMRQTRDQGAGVGVGLIVATLAVLVVVHGLYNVVTTKSAEQEEIEELRRKEVYLDPVAKEQLRASEGAQAAHADERGPIDDRRSRRASRRPTEEQNS